MQSRYQVQPVEQHAKASNQSLMKTTGTFLKITQQKDQGAGSGFVIEEPVVLNDAHNTMTNNGFARKPCGGFYYH